MLRRLPDVHAHIRGPKAFHATAQTQAIKARDAWRRKHHRNRRLPDVRKSMARHFLGAIPHLRAVQVEDVNERDRCATTKTYIPDRRWNARQAHPPSATATPGKWSYPKGRAIPKNCRTAKKNTPNPKRGCRTNVPPTFCIWHSCHDQRPVTIAIKRITKPHAHPTTSTAAENNRKCPICFAKVSEQNELTSSRVKMQPGCSPTPCAKHGWQAVGWVIAVVPSERARAHSEIKSFPCHGANPSN